MSERHSDVRVLRWTDRIERVIAGEVRGPIRANLDLTNLCSHNCAWCEPLDFRKATIADARHTLPYDIVVKVLADLAEIDCRAVQFSGGGEPTLHPDFGAFLWQAKFGNMRTFVVTHGGFIDKWLPELRDHADHIRVSLDACNEDTHREMHGTKPGEFDKILQNVRALVKARNGAKAPEIGLAYIVADCNSRGRDLWTFLMIAKNLGVDYVQFRPLSEPEPQRLTVGWERAKREIAEVPQGVAWPFRIEILGQRQKDVFLQREFSECYAALTVATISANGDVCACCDERGIVFGSLHTKSFKDIWLSPEHRAIAAKINPKLCGRCVLCGYNRAVEKYVINNEAVPELI